MTEERMTMTPGMQVTPNVRLLAPLGAGGMGAVWLADHAGLKTRVVVKFMLGGLDSSAGARLRFSREAAAAAQVKSPHVVQMLDHGVTDDGVPFIVMEHLEGRDLAVEIREKGPLAPADVVMIVAQVAKALAKVHAAGLLHRDIKPDNIFLCSGEEERFVKLLDFGIAKNATGSDAKENELPLDSETKTGQIVGTPYYMSPEQVTAQKVIDHRADVWALGVVAVEALTGKKPFDGPSFGALAVMIATGAPPKPTSLNASLPPLLDEWFAKACARDPMHRFESARALADALRAAFEGVVSLPQPTPMSDSGRRDEAAAKLELAATQESSPLGKSEPGSSVVTATSTALTPPRARSTTFIIGVAAAIGGIAVAAAFINGRASANVDPPPRPSAARAALGAGGPSKSVPATPSTEPTPSSPPSGLSDPVGPATAAAASASASAAPSGRGNVRPPSSASAVAVGHGHVGTKPEASAKPPASSEPVKPVPTSSASKGDLW